MKKIISLFLAIVLLLSLCACGKTQETTEESSAAAESTSTEESEKISFTYMEWGDETLLKDAAERFMAMYPNVEITIDNCGHVYDDYVNKLRITMAAGEGPEVFKLQPGTLADQFQEYVYPIDSLLEDEYGSNWKDNFVEAIWDQAEVDGIGWIGAPTYLSLVGCVWVNETLLEQNGLTVPTTYEELVACCKTLRENGVLPMAVGAMDDWNNQDFIVTLFNQFAPGKVYEVETGNGNWTDEDMVEALAQWQSFFNDGVFVDGAIGLSVYNDALDMFNNGKAAFFFNGHWNMGEYMNAEKSPAMEENYEWSVIPLPAPEGKEPAVQVALSDFICINKNIEDDATREMAYKFAMYYSSEYMSEFSKGEYVMQTAFKGIELNTPFYGESGPKMAEQLQEMVSYSKGERELTNVDTKAELMTVLQELAMGTLTPEEGAARVQSVAD